MSSTIPDVLVVGAGPVGLVSALVLVQNGVPVRIIEKSTSFAIGQRGAGIAPRSQEAFKFLGILDDIFAAGAGKVADNREYDADGKPTHDEPAMDPQPATAEIPYPMFAHLGQDSTTAVLRRHLEKYSVSVELGTELVGLEQDEAGVSATLKATSGEERLRVKYVVGADGGQGPTRKLTGIKFLGESHRDIRMVIGDVELTGLDNDHWHRFQPGKNVVVARPIVERPGSFFLAVMGPELDTARAGTDVAYLTSFIHDVTKHEDIELTKIMVLREWSLNVRMADTFRVGRVFIAGDAAHVHSPTGGQGMNSGIMDAMNLSWKLALAVKSLASPGLLDTYTVERLPVIREMLQYTSQLAWSTFTPPEKSAASESAFRRPLIGRQLGVHYRWSPIVYDETGITGIKDETAFVEPPSAYGIGADERLHAGDRAPSARGTTGGVQTTLFDIFSPTKHTVLVLAPGVLLDVYRAIEGMKLPVRVIAVVAAEEAGKTDREAFVDVEGTIKRAYGTEAKVAVVRPDGVVGALTRGAEGMQKYLAAI